MVLLMLTHPVTEGVGLRYDVEFVVFDFGLPAYQESEDGYDWRADACQNPHGGGGGHRNTGKPW